MLVCTQCRSIFNGEIEFCAIDGAKLVTTDVDPMIGVELDRYRIVERLGEGGMACVYRAVHTEIGRQGAVKVLFGEMSADRKMAERFRREAQSIARIDHRNVVSVLDYGTSPEGVTFMIMELLSGKTLSQLIHDRPGFGSIRAALLTRQLAAGLGAAHKLGMVHRDLKPGNIVVIQEDGMEVPKILDFGLVSVKGDDAFGSDKLTKTGHTMGTPYYMSPEQLRGQEVTARSDLYSLGCVLYEMLRGEMPFGGNMSEVLYKHAFETPPPLRPADGLETIAYNLLEKEPGKRVPDAEALIEEIDKLGILPAGIATTGAFYAVNPNRNSIAAHPATLGETAIEQPGLQPKSDSSWRTLMMAAAVLFLLALGVVLMLIQDPKDLRVLSVEPAVEPMPDPMPDPVVEPKVEPVPEPKVEPEVEPEAAPAPETELAPEPEPAKSETTPSRDQPKRPRPKHKTPVASGPSIPELSSRVAMVVASRGLTMDDVSSLASSGAWRQAKESGDRDRAKSAANAFIAEVRSMPIGRPLVKQKLQEALQMLNAVSKELPADQARALQNRVFEMKARSRRLDDRGRADLMLDLVKLRRDVDAAKTGSK